MSPLSGQPQIPPPALTDASALELKQLWDRWTRVVALYASARRRVAQPMPAEEYRRLHEALCRGFQLRSAVGDETRRMAFRELHALVAPWVTLGSLSRAHRDVVGSIRGNCIELGAVVGWRPSSGPRQVSKAAVAGVMLAAAAVGLLWFLANRGLFSAGAGHAARRIAEELDYYVFRHANSATGLLILSVTLTLLGMWVANSVRKA